MNIKNSGLGEIIIIAAIAVVVVLVIKLSHDNKTLSEKNGELSTQISEVLEKNGSLAKSVQGLTEQISAVNDIVATESKRRAAAEMKTQKLNEEIKSALKSNVCAVQLVPTPAVDGLRRAEDSARSGGNQADTNAGKSAN